ncbi:DUF6984 family protein [Niveispirillum lacus]|uniref:DUF6984 family protein n=1 Tax=Niveispirillum lacus TaxID=1981099 RepID=UPI001A9C7AAE|nr:hypothetical protein [Niveispirillum lacus]
MSVESPHHDHDGLRRLRSSEIALLKELLSKCSSLHLIDGGLDDILVRDMNDGGMGSILFSGDENRIIGGSIVDADYFDSDGVLVNISVNVDNSGKIYEVDFWKVDFSPLLVYPCPDSIKIHPTPVQCSTISG